METKQTYQVGEHYLTKNRQGNYCRTWYDASTQQRKSSSLRTSDFEEAKLKLDAWFIENIKPVNDATLPLSRCLLEYFNQHATHLARSNVERHNLTTWLEYFPELLVTEIRPAKQREFITFLVNKGYAKSTVQSIFKSGVAAVNFAWKNEMFPTSIPFVSLDKELKKFFFPATARWRPLHMAEVVSLIEHANSARLQRFIMVLLSTGSRPSAALELTGEQIDLHAGTINLLPSHRAQNNKYRPIVRLPDFIRAIYHGDNICSRKRIALNPKRPMDSIKPSWDIARKKANMDTLVNPYSIRHTMAKWLRTCGVAPWETSGQLGHKRQGNEITELYASFDPHYLTNALDAIEGYFALVYQSSRALQEADWLKEYVPRCDLVAKYGKFVSQPFANPRNP